MERGRATGVIRELNTTEPAVVEQVARALAGTLRATALRRDGMSVRWLT